jgi:hypothetical protein
MSIKNKMYHEQQKPTIEEKQKLLIFFTHILKTRDPKGDIEKCINYALKESPSFGGFVLSVIMRINYLRCCSE